MESEKQMPSSLPSEVAKFYDGKTLFITGAAGYLGTILLEALLRCCPGIHRIYILIRPKKGVQPEDRKENVFKKDIFYKIRESYPDVLNKVSVVTGDVAQDNLGMNVEDLHKVSEEVSIVFHCAATISFIKPLSFVIQQNVIGTYNAIELCRKLKKLEVFSYTSTSYSNCNRSSVIEEKIYKLPFTAEEVVKAYKSASGEKELMRFFTACEPKFPNFYTFTKCVSETLVAEKATDFPAFIVRPSIVICCYKGPLPGYIEDGTGLTNISLAVGKGFVRILRCDPEKRANQIPVDVVANAHIVAAYRQIVDKLPSPFIYNCVASKRYCWLWGEFVTSLYNMVCKHPLPCTFQKPCLIICNNDVKYWIHSAFDHYGPAAVIDSVLWLSGRKPRLLKLYQFYEQSMSVITYFLTNEWEYKTENLESLNDKMNATDKELFPVDLKEDFTLEHINNIILKGSPMYKKGYSKYNEMTPKYVPLYLTAFIKWSLMGGLASALYMVLF